MPFQITPHEDETVLVCTPQAGFDVYQDAPLMYHRVFQHSERLAQPITCIMDLSSNRLSFADLRYMVTVATMYQQEPSKVCYLNNIFVGANDMLRQATRSFHTSRLGGTMYFRTLDEALTFINRSAALH